MSANDNVWIVDDDRSIRWVLETAVKDKLLERCEPWLSKQVSLEMDSMGPI